MKRSNAFLLSLLAMLFLGLYACQHDSGLLPETELTPRSPENEGQSSENCFNFRVSATDLPVGCACMSAPMVCPTGDPVFCNFGAKSFSVEIGDYEGSMSSVVTNYYQSGNGAMHLDLMHYFVSSDGNHAFWTEDQAVCAPGSEAYSCIVNDVLTIIGGCGDFEGAYGKLRNKGVLTFYGVTETCDVFYQAEEAEVETGSLDVELSGRICAPGLNED